MDYRRIFVDGSAIFITLVTSKRRKILLENIDLLREAFNRAIQVYNFEIIAMCVLPDHLHMLIKPYEIKDYPNIVKQIKTFFSAKIKKEYLFDYDVSSSKLRKKECDVWQRRYWEHTIRSEFDFYRHIDYIHLNACKHGYVLAAKDWKYSSFMDFVAEGLYDINWCNLGDKNEINNLDFE